MIRSLTFPKTAYCKPLYGNDADNTICAFGVSVEPYLNFKIGVAFWGGVINAAITVRLGLIASFEFPSQMCGCDEGISLSLFFFFVFFLVKI